MMKAFNSVGMLLLLIMGIYSTFLGARIEGGICVIMAMLIGLENLLIEIKERIR